MYIEEHVRKLIEQQGQNFNPDILRHLGEQEGGSRQAQHEAAIQWCDIALSVESLSLTGRMLVEAERAKHVKALEPPPQVNRYGPPPDFKGQPV